jgi:ubiquinone/menaquinone biosynthesis C-methylase UbiE
VAGLWEGGDAYEAYVGRWSRLVADEFLDWLNLPDGVVWLDVGCGTGELTRTILERTHPSQVIGVEPSSSFVAHAIDRTQGTTAELGEASADALPFADARFDATVSALVLNFIPDPVRGVSEMARVTRAGGCVAAIRLGLRGEDGDDPPPL